MKNFNVIIPFFLVVNFSVSAQQFVPGYFGKKTLFTYSNYFFPSLVGPTANKSIGGDRDIEVNALTNTDFLGLNSKHTVELERIVSTWSSVFIGYEFFKSGVDYRSMYSSTEGTYSYLGNNQIPIKYQSNNLIVGWKFYNSKQLAPLGWYSKFSIKYHFAKYSYNNHFNFRPKESSNTIEQNTGMTSFQKRNFSIVFSFGKQRVFFDNLLVSYGASSGYTPFASDALLKKYGADGIEESIRYDGVLRLHRLELINLFLSIGFIR